MFTQFIQAYNRVILRQPLATLVAIICIVVFFLMYLLVFDLDALSDSLVR